jgi:hypothetical protein
MPEEAKGKFFRKGFKTLHICRREISVGTCTDVGQPVLLADGTSGSFSERLPKELSSGGPRILIYYIEALNTKSRSSLVLDEVATIAGNPPEPLSGLTAELQRGGVLLRWPPRTDTHRSEATFVRVYRRFRDREHDDNSENHTLSSGQQENIVSTTRAGVGAVLDKSVRRGESYLYEAHLVTQVKLKDRTLELTGELSAPVCIDDVRTPDADHPQAEASAALFVEGSCRTRK